MSQPIVIAQAAISQLDNRLDTVETVVKSSGESGGSGSGGVLTEATADGWIQIDEGYTWLSDEFKEAEGCRARPNYILYTNKNRQVAIELLDCPLSGQENYTGKVFNDVIAPTNAEKHEEGKPLLVEGISEEVTGPASSTGCTLTRRYHEPGLFVFIPANTPSLGRLILPRIRYTGILPTLSQR